jgi:hypothetical protein
MRCNTSHNRDLTCRHLLLLFQRQDATTNQLCPNFGTGLGTSDRSRAASELTTKFPLALHHLSSLRLFFAYVRGLIDHEDIPFSGTVGGLTIVGYVMQGGPKQAVLTQRSRSTLVCIVKRSDLDPQSQSHCLYVLPRQIDFYKGISDRSQDGPFTLHVVIPQYIHD